MWMILPHHKLQVRWNKTAIRVRLPQQLQDLLTLYLEQGQHVVSPNSPYIFSDSKGKAMLEATSMTIWFHQLLRTLGSPAIFPPNRWTSIPLKAAHMW